MPNGVTFSVGEPSGTKVKSRFLQVTMRDKQMVISRGVIVTSPHRENTDLENTDYQITIDLDKCNPTDLGNAMLIAFSWVQASKTEYTNTR